MKPNFAEWFAANRDVLLAEYRENPDGCKSFLEFVRKWWKEMVA